MGQKSIDVHHPLQTRDRFAISVPKPGIESTRTATKFLTGHCELKVYWEQHRGSMSYLIVVILTK